MDRSLGSITSTVGREGKRKKGDRRGEETKRGEEEPVIEPMNVIGYWLNWLRVLDARAENPGSVPRAYNEWLTNTSNSSSGALPPLISVDTAHTWCT